MSGNLSDALTHPINFAIPLEARVRAATGGPPAYIRRRREIEDLTDFVTRELAELVSAPEVDRMEWGRRAVGRHLARLNDLIDRHNRYYPIEANLPFDPRTGEILERSGVPFRPLPHIRLTEVATVAGEMLGGSRAAAGAHCDGQRARVEATSHVDAGSDRIEAP